MKSLRLVLILLIFISCNTVRTNNSPKTYNILFVGNSLTYTNNLPKLVEATAKAKDITIKTQTIALPNYALIDHWNEGKVQKEIQTKQYDYVIVQQGPSSQKFGKEILINYGKRIRCFSISSKL